ncbi:uncharacterized protein EI97DRAFT_301119 [Westerdykella ornata]|uniref:Uncharacterized protein n=1 Tax=Westerdykella ornata TaxID=318751 RepID=A0A6A6JRT8_WESOR|nr:uncharacterized protein EI97DRAFT_301119 [Westerdykella ornata]KAF2277669.1 hypothetical protein EI97DRAFT_301119 [Westerdykella ornata]
MIRSILISYPRVRITPPGGLTSYSADRKEQDNGSWAHRRWRNGGVRPKPLSIPRAFPRARKTMVAPSQSTCSSGQYRMARLEWLIYTAAIRIGRSRTLPAGVGVPLDSSEIGRLVGYGLYCGHGYRRESEFEDVVILNTCLNSRLTSFCTSCQQTHPPAEYTTL